MPFKDKSSEIDPIKKFGSDIWILTKMLWKLYASSKVYIKRNHLENDFFHFNEKNLI